MKKFKGRKNREEQVNTTFEFLHGKPKTRREFLASGLMSFSASLTLPSLITLLTRPTPSVAQSLACGSASASGLCPFVTLNLRGGAALAANFVPHDKDRKLLSSYNKMGLGTGANLTIDREFGNVPFAGGGISNILTGIRQTATASTLLRSAFVGVPVRSQDDSTANKFDLSGMVTRAGLVGSQMPNLGRSMSDTGLGQMYAMVKPPTPLVVSNFSDIAGSVQVADTIGTALSEQQKVGLFSMIEKLSTSQARRIASDSGGTELGNLVTCATNANTKLIATPGSNIDPNLNQTFRTVWNLQNNADPGNQNYVFGAMVYNAIRGNAGTVNLEMGGYDYHDNTRTSGNARDLAAGQAIGRILQSFAVMQTKGFLVVMSDGSVSSAVSNSTTAPWVSDRGSAGCAYMISYDPAKRPVTRSFQLGQFTAAQAADDQFITGNLPELASAAMFVNYLAFNKKTTLQDLVIPRVFTAADLEDIIVFA